MNQTRSTALRFLHVGTVSIHQAVAVRLVTIHVEIVAKNKSFFWNVLLNIRFPSARTFDAILDDLGRNCLDKSDRDVSM